MLRDWNVVVTVHSRGYNEARRILSPFGAVADTEFYNVIVMLVDDVSTFLDDFQQCLAAEPGILNDIAHVMPVSVGFVFQDPLEFERKAEDCIDVWIPRFGGKSFHVRMHRRGFKGKLSSQHEEQFLDHHIMQQLAQSGLSARIDFDDPDLILAVETVGQRAGLALWTREQRQRYPFLPLT